MEKYEIKNKEEAEKILKELLEKSKKAKNEMFEADRKRKEYEKEVLRLQDIHIKYAKEATRIFKEYNLDYDLII